jgi:hypothetical protein
VSVWSRSLRPFPVPDTRCPPAENLQYDDPQTRVMSSVLVIEDDKKTSNSWRNEITILDWLCWTAAKEVKPNGETRTCRGCSRDADEEVGKQKTTLFCGDQSKPGREVDRDSSIHISSAVLAVPGVASTVWFLSSTDWSGNLWSLPCLLEHNTPWFPKQVC